MTTPNIGTFQMKPEIPAQPIIWAFRGDYAFLSNFQSCDVTLPAENDLPSMDFTSTEHAYMAWKTLDLETRKTIQTLTPGQAKKLTHQENFPLRPDYSDLGRLDIMSQLTEQKYSARNPDMLEKVIATNYATLIEGNTWGDTFFGFDLLKGWGNNHLGRIIMKHRGNILASLLL